MSCSLREMGGLRRQDDAIVMARKINEATVSPERPHSQTGCSSCCCDSTNETFGNVSPRAAGKGGSWKADPCAETGRGAAYRKTSKVSAKLGVEKRLGKLTGRPAPKNESTSGSKLFCSVVSTISLPLFV